MKTLESILTPFSEDFLLLRELVGDDRDKLVAIFQQARTGRLKIHSFWPRNCYWVNVEYQTLEGDPDILCRKGRSIEILMGTPMLGSQWVLLTQNACLEFSQTLHHAHICMIKERNVHSPARQFLFRKDFDEDAIRKIISSNRIVRSQAEELHNIPEAAKPVITLDNLVVLKKDWEHFITSAQQPPLVAAPPEVPAPELEPEPEVSEKEEETSERELDTLRFVVGILSRMYVKALDGNAVFIKRQEHSKLATKTGVINGQALQDEMAHFVAANYSEEHCEDSPVTHKRKRIKLRGKREIYKIINAAVAMTEELFE